MIFWFILCAGAVLAEPVSVPASILVSPQTRAVEWPIANPGVHSHVHRGGGAKERPDNTLETFIWSWEHGVGVECDCRMTGDGVAIMLHDGNLRRTGRNADAKLLQTPVAKLKYADIAKVDVGSYISPEFALERVPTLEAVLEAMAKRPGAQIFVDDKGVGPERLAAMARKHGVLDRVWYTQCRLELLQAWRKVAPEGKTRLWWGPGTNKFDPASRERGRLRLEKKMAELRACDFAGVTLICFDTHYDGRQADPFIPSSDYWRQLAAEYHRRGIVFTLIPYGGGDQKESYLKLRQLGCDGFCTDNPSVLFSALDEMRRK